MRALGALAIILAASTLTGCGGQAPEAAPDGGPASTGQQSGIVGLVRLGPRCPVETSSSPCGARPAAGSTVAAARGRPVGSRVGGRVVGRTTTDADGRFRIGLRPGTYVVTADAGLSCRPVSVRVVAGDFSTIDLTCDTGIR